MKYRFFFICLVSTICLGQTAAQDIRNVPEVPYEWSNVPIVGGGFVDGIVFHPTDRNVRSAGPIWKVMKTEGETANE